MRIPSRQANTINGSVSVGNPNPESPAVLGIILGFCGVFLILIVVTMAAMYWRRYRTAPAPPVERQRASRKQPVLSNVLLESMPIIKFGEADRKLCCGEKRTRLGVGTDETVVMDPGRCTPQNRNEINSSRSIENAGLEGIVKEQGTQPTGGGHKLDTETTTDRATMWTKLGISCVICEEDFELGQNVRVLPCSHGYHPACVDPWLLNKSGTCPLW